MTCTLDLTLAKPTKNVVFVMHDVLFDNTQKLAWAVGSEKRDRAEKDSIVQSI